jgi:hypothetical protein
LRNQFILCGNIYKVVIYTTINFNEKYYDLTYFALPIELKELEKLINLKEFL